MENDPLSFPPLEAEVDDFSVDNQNRIWVRLRFGDGSYWTIDLPIDSAEEREILDAIARATTQLVARVAGRGVVISGLTPVEEEEEP